jgi:hypothetical protein
MPKSYRAAKAKAVVNFRVSVGRCASYQAFVIKSPVMDSPAWLSTLIGAAFAQYTAGYATKWCSLVAAAAATERERL